MHHLIDQKPIRLNVTFAHTLIVPGCCQRMIPILFRKRLFRTEQCNNCFKLFRVTAAFDGQLIVLFELPGKFWLKH